MTELSTDSRIKGIIFDLDGTLYRLHWYMRPILTFNVFPHCLRLPRFLKVRSSFSGVEMVSGENLMRAICDKLAAIEKCTTKEINFWIKNQFYPSFVNSMKYFHKRSDVNETLQPVRNKGIKLAVLSDYDQVKERLEILKINPVNFDIMISSETFGALKPASRPFLEIATQWKLAPEEILVIGDRNDTDGVAARNAKMNFIQITDKNISNQNIQQWNEIRTYLATL